jgi:hypothetical protein
VLKKPYTLSLTLCQSVRECPNILKIIQKTNFDMGFLKINMRSRLEKVDFLRQFHLKFQEIYIKNLRVSYFRASSIDEKLQISVRTVRPIDVFLHLNLQDMKANIKTDIYTKMPTRKKINVI